MIDEHSSIQAEKPQRKSLFALLLVGGALVVMLVFLVRNQLHSRKVFVWMTPQEVAASMDRGPVTKLKDRVLRASALLWQWYMKGKTQMTIDSRFLTISDGALLNELIVGPSFINVDGTRAWILTAEELKRVKSEPVLEVDRSVIIVGRVTLAEGMRAEISSSGDSGNTTVTLWPRVSSHSVDLLLCARYTTGTAAPQTSTPAGTTTNFETACRVVVPSGGALLTEARRKDKTGGTNYWFILTPTAIDAAGNSKKL